MASWIHCNKCFTRPQQPGATFFITECGHVFCKICGEKIKISSSCMVCSKKTSVLQLDKNVDYNIRQHFIPFGNNLKTCFDIYKFQDYHQQRLVKHLDEKYNYLKNEYSKNHESNKKTIKLLAEENKKLKMMLKCRTSSPCRFGPRLPVVPIWTRPVVPSIPLTKKNMSFLNMTVPTISQRMPFGTSASIGNASNNFHFDPLFRSGGTVRSRINDQSSGSSQRPSPAQLVSGSGRMSVDMSARKRLETIPSIREFIQNLRKKY